MADTEKTSVLLVNDRTDQLLTLESILAPLGQELVKASSGQEALRLLLNKDFSIILLDVKMPVMDGASAVLKLREDPEMKDARVAFLTSLGDPRLEIQDINRKFSSEFGAQGYLKKTDDLDVLTEKIRGFLK